MCEGRQEPAGVVTVIVSKSDEDMTRLAPTVSLEDISLQECELKFVGLQVARRKRSLELE
jgi:hypothetical protein